VDAGRVIDDGAGLSVTAADDGTLTVTHGERTFVGLGAVEDRGDRGDTYDFAPVADDPGATLLDTRVERRLHPSGIARLLVTRRFAVPESLDPSGEHRAPGEVTLTLTMEARVALGLGRVDLLVTADNPARDHRLRLCFPTGAPTERFRAATTFGVAERSNAPVAHHGWWHDPPTTFPHQGWIAANGLTVAAPGLPEAEVTDDGTIAITLLRAVGWLSRSEMPGRPIAAGPALATPDAQCPAGVTAAFTIRVDDPALVDSPGPSAALALGDELGLRAVPAGDAPVLAEGHSLVRITSEPVVLSTLKPAEDGNGLILRLLNPTPEAVEPEVTLDFPFTEVGSVRLDEEPDEAALAHFGPTVRLPVGPHALRSLRIRID
ncbi:MAG: glycosyl hydrolase-related protein, partial [Actinomycetota bacterium]